MQPPAKSFALPVPLNTPKKYPSSASSKLLSHIFAETLVKESNLEYQRLLIANKELELRVGELEVELGHLSKQRRKAERAAEEVRQKKELALAQFKEKQCYLKKYYDELDRKFRGGRDDLFAGLKKLEHNLLEMYERDQRRIR
jgi:hypothetical protein